jgi:hypothetical protein
MLPPMGNRAVLRFKSMGSITNSVDWYTQTWRPHGQIAPKFADLVRKCGEHGVRLFVHEDAKKDIERDRDTSRRDASLSRVRKFNLLSGIPKPDYAALG